MRVPSPFPLNRLAGLARQRGVAAVEFALVALFFFTLLIGIMEFGRWLFVLNAANEATRLGARLAVVCSIADAPKIRTAMSRMTGGQIPASRMVITYSPASCDASNCKNVTASVSGATFTPLIPGLSQAFPIPAFTTNLTREYMKSTDDSGVANPVCPP